MVSLFFLPASAGGMAGKGGAFHSTILSLILLVNVEQLYQTAFAGTLGSVAVCVPCITTTTTTTTTTNS